MHKILGTSDKTIGFRLSGHLVFPGLTTGQLILDQNYIYEITIVPGKDPQGTITHSGRFDAKPIPVELPKEIEKASYEKIYSFLMHTPSKLIVLSEGYEKLGNRRLLVRIAPLSAQSPVNCFLLIEGKFENTEYKIMINPHDLTQSEGEIQDNISKDYKKAHLLLKDITTIKEELIKKILGKLKSNHIMISVKGNDIAIFQSKTLKELIPKLTPPDYRQHTKGLKTRNPNPEEVEFDNNNTLFSDDTTENNRKNSSNESHNGVSILQEQRFFIKKLDCFQPNAID